METAHLLDGVDDFVKRPEAVRTAGKVGIGRSVDRVNLYGAHRERCWIKRNW